MFISLRTTVFWNMCLLMVLSAMLISLVVYRIMEREIQRESALTGKAVLTAVGAGVTSLIQQDQPAAAREELLRGLLKQHVDLGVCETIILVGTDFRVLAQWPGHSGNHQLFDPDITSALESGGLITRMERLYAPGGPRIVAAAPLQIEGRSIGALRAVIPLQDISRSMRHAFSFIFFYIIISAAILSVVGFLLFTRYLVSPMQRLLRQTEAIAEENIPEATLFLTGGNELQRLSSGLKSLAENLKLDRGRLRQQMQALEEKNLQLKNAQREIIQSEKLGSIGRLAAGVAHEVGNPLGIILGYIHLLRSSESTPQERADYLSRLEHETERIRTTIGDLLNFARPSAQDITELQLDVIVREICSMIACHKEFRNIVFEQELDPELPPLCGNDRLVRQMLLNLCLNACDAMQPAGGTLRIQTALDPGADTIRITVSDTGHGIEPEQQKKIFEPFFTTKDSGTGLGLANVHRIVELMAGSISFETAVGRGTAFTILLPAAVESTRE